MARLTVSGLGDSSVTANALTNASLANRTRRYMLGAGDFVGTGTGVGSGSANFSVTNERNRGAALTLGNNVNNVVTATFVVPTDFVAGSVPKMTLWWATDEGGTSRQVDADISFMPLSSMSTSTSAVTFRYNIRNSSGSDATAMDSLNPNQSQVVQQTMPEGAESWSGSPTWSPGDIIVLSIGRNGTSGSDPNSGNMYIYGVSFDYTSDM